MAKVVSISAQPAVDSYLTFRVEWTYAKESSPRDCDVSSLEVSKTAAVPGRLFTPARLLYLAGQRQSAFLHLVGKLRELCGQEQSVSIEQNMVSRSDLYDLLDFQNAQLRLELELVFNLTVNLLD